MYQREGMPKIALNQGEVAFKNFAENLKNKYSLPSIEFRQDLQIEINSDPKKWTDKEYITSLVNNKKNQFKDSPSPYRNFVFHFDVGSTDPEISFIIQLVDDTPFKGTRSKNILNQHLKYVGISTMQVKQKKCDKNCGYFLFAN
jgi:hypothetical protein